MMWECGPGSVSPERQVGGEKNPILYRRYYNNIFAKAFNRPTFEKWFAYEYSGPDLNATFATKEEWEQDMVEERLLGKHIKILVEE